jgi:hypothetical protein
VRHALAAVALALTVATRADAQRAAVRSDSLRSDSLSSCPVSEGFGLSFDFSGGARPDGARPDSARPDTSRAPTARRTSLALDTTYTFDVAERTWTRTNIEASVAAGAAGSRPSGGRWNVCAGARAFLESATLTIRRARGTVRLHVSLEPLAAIGRRAPTDTPRR